MRDEDCISLLFFYFFYLSVTLVFCARFTLFPKGGGAVTLVRSKRSLVPSLLMFFDLSAIDDASPPARSLSPFLFFPRPRLESRRFKRRPEAHGC